mmetsp:Transcript_9928/g.9826  ORF Transcript_9928/g.9826 Transcript_9928/m.9826 type:complete len:97 (+) Transcript_9928:624-914(+)
MFDGQKILYILENVFDLKTLFSEMYDYNKEEELILRPFSFMRKKDLVGDIKDNYLNILESKELFQVLPHVQKDNNKQLREGFFNFFLKIFKNCILD